MLEVAAFVAAGPLLGVYAWYADRVQWDFRHGSEYLAQLAGLLGNIPSPWLALAFLAGIVGRRPLPGALGGTLVLCAAVLCYYAAITAAGDREGIPLQDAIYGWLGVALLAGPVYGAAGGVWRSGPSRLRAVALGLMAAALLAEAAILLSETFEYLPAEASNPRLLLGLVDLAIALGAPVVLLKPSAERNLAYGTALALGVPAFAAMYLLTNTLRDMFNA